MVEIEDDFVIAGIGCNVFHSPNVLECGSEAGREATCLWEHTSMESLKGCDFPDLPVGFSGEPPHEYMKIFIEHFARMLYISVSCWLESADDNVDSVIFDCQRKLATGPQRLRGNNKSIHEGSEILPLRINRDGSLEVSVSL